MNRIDRLLGILTYLQSRKFTTAEKIAERFEISVRTVYRDIKALNEQGIPIGFDAGKGYHVLPGYFLPLIWMAVPHGVVHHKRILQTSPRHHQRSDLGLRHPAHALNVTGHKRHDADEGGEAEHHAQNRRRKRPALEKFQRHKSALILF